VSTLKFENDLSGFSTDDFLLIPSRENSKELFQNLYVNINAEIKIGET